MLTMKKFLALTVLVVGPALLLRAAEPQLRPERPDAARALAIPTGAARRSRAARCRPRPAASIRRGS